MWSQKYFKTEKEMEKWIEKNGNKYQYCQLFCSNIYCLEIKKLKIIDIK